MPRYRGPFQGEIKADTHGAFAAEVHNVGVPDWSIPAEFRDVAKELTFYQGVGALQSIIEDTRRTGETVVAMQFPVSVAVATKVVVDHQTVRMWKELPVAMVAGILDAVRSKALEFTLEIEAENPEAGTTVTTEPPVPLGRADVIFNTVIYGGQVAIGPAASVTIAPGDLGSLMAYLEAQSVTAEDRRDLEAALAADGNSLGDRVKGWLGSMSAKTASFGASAAANATGGIDCCSRPTLLGHGVEAAAMTYCSVGSLVGSSHRIELSERPYRRHSERERNNRTCQL